MVDSKLSVAQICSAREAIYGASQSLLTLASSQRSAGTCVSFVTFKGKKFGSEVREMGFRTHEVKVRGKGDVLAILNLAKLLRREGVDIVHTHLSTSSVIGCLAARLARIPSVATVHGMSGRYSFFAATHIIAVSEGVKTHLLNQGVDKTRISVVHNGLDTSFVPPSRAVAREELAITDDTPVIGTVSRITANKGIDDAIRAIARLIKEYPNLQYFVVGDGDAMEQNRQLARDLGVEHCVKFLGYRKDVANCLAAFDVFLFPTLKEAMGIALVEAMACGLPIVSTNVDGIPEVITPETGILVGPRQPDALAFATRRILSDASTALELGESARRRAERLFSAVAMENNTDAVYRRILKRPERSTLEVREAQRRLARK